MPEQERSVEEAQRAPERQGPGRPTLMAPAAGTNHQGAPPVTKIQRTVEILRILQRHQFFQFLKELSQAERVKGIQGRTELKIPEEAPGRVRRMLEEAGPTFIKIGQLLGTRPDLIPQEFCDEFKKLYDRTTPNSFAEIKLVVEDELGRPMEEVFASFDEQPVASASIGQVHFATLRSGERVAVKVQHPAIEARVALDFEILEPIINFIERVFAGSRVWQPRAHLEEVRVMLAKELDYTYEARNHHRVFKNFKVTPGVKVPRIFWDHSSRRMLTLEYIDGIKMEDIEAGEVPGLDGTSVARIITHAMGKQIFEDRIFHADPSPGNLLILDSHTVAFLDFGAVGIVTRRRAERILQLIVGFMRDDLDMVAQSLIAICNKTGDYDPAAFKRDLERVMEFHEQERASPGNPEMLDRIIEIAERHNMLLPSDFLLINRALFQFEGMCRRLDPEYELIDVLGPYVKEVLYARYTNPERQKDALVDIGIQVAELVKNAPGRVNNILRKLEQDEFAVRVNLGGLEDHQRHQEQLVHRASVAAIAAVFILSTGIIVANGRSEDLLRFTFVGLFVVLFWMFTLVWSREK